MFWLPYWPLWFKTLKRQKLLRWLSSRWAASQQKSCDSWNTPSQINTHGQVFYHNASDMSTICRRRFELTSNHISLAGHVWGEIARAWGAQGGTNKRLSERSSHWATVNCQAWYRAEALLLPADKVGLMRSAEPLHLCTRLDEGKGGSGCRDFHQVGALWLHYTAAQQQQWARRTCSSLGHQIQMICCVLPGNIHVKVLSDA